MNKTRNIVPKRSEDCILLAKFVSEKDERAFAQIVRKYENLVWNICCRVLHNRHDAEDAFQSTFLLLASKARRIRNPKSLSSWLYGVAFRTASSVRRQRLRDMLPYESSVDPGLEDDVLQYVAQKNENELVSAEIMLMKEKHKTLLLMFYFMGDSTSQIANTLGITVSAVEGRLRQARRALRSKLRLRGIDFDTTCAALVVPVLAMNPSLSVATISQVMTASVAGIASTTLGFLTSMNNTGAKLMLTKIAVSCSLVCVAAVGALHHATGNQDGTYITQIDSNAEFESKTVPIKFVQDEEEGEDQSSTASDVHEHLVHIHNQLYGLWKRITGSEEEDKAHTEKLLLRLQSVEKADSAKNIWITEIPVVNKLNVTQHAADVRIVTRLSKLEPDTIWLAEVDVDTEPLVVDLATVADVELHQDVPVLSDLPIIGHLFSKTTERLLGLEATDSNEYRVIEVLPAESKDDVPVDESFEYNK